MYAVNLFYVSVVTTYWFNTCFGVHTISEEIYLPLSQEITISSPGYPWRNYERDTNYTWMVTAPDVTEAIDIRIEMDVHKTPGFPCYDYLKIQEINTYFTLFQKCGKRTANRIARGNKLMITLFSNHDILTTKGFRLSLKVSKISTRRTTKATLTTTTISLLKISMTQMTRTPSTKKFFPHKSTTKIKATTPKILSTKTPSTTEITTRKTVKSTFPDSTDTQPTTSKEIVSSTSAPWYSSQPPLPEVEEVVGTSNTINIVITTGTCFCVHTESKEIYLPLSQEITIESPGYPWRNYYRNTTYIWIVSAPEETKEIYLEIELQIHKTTGFAGYDYLKIQEITGSNFTLFNQCGNVITNRNAQGNKLMITLYSNDDRFTDKGFQLTLTVSKISRRSTLITTLATTFLPTLKISTTPKEKKTTTAISTKKSLSEKFSSTIQTTILKILSTKIPSSREVTTRKTMKTNFRNSTATQLTTSKEIMSKVLSSSPGELIKSSSPDSTAFQHATKEITTEVLSSVPVTLDRSMSPLPSTRGIMGASTDSQHTINSEIPNSSSTILNAITSTETTTFALSREMDTQHSINSEIPNSPSTTINAVTSTEITTFVLSREMVILMVGIGVVEVSIIIVGILAVKRFRQNKNNMTRHSKEKVGRPVSRKTVCSIDNVYATIPEEEFDENPYKDLSEGVYDTTSKRRSHVNGGWNEYSRGSFFTRLFRSSKISGSRPVEEAHPMFSTFRDTKKGTA